jgi:hypothetical protein
MTVNIYSGFYWLIGSGIVYAVSVAAIHTYTRKAANDDLQSSQASR